MRSGYKFWCWPALLVFVVAGCTDSPGVSQSSGEDMQIVDLAMDAMGGREAWAALNGLSFRSDRDYYIMGQGPEPGRGLMRLAHVEMQVRRDIRGDRLKLDALTRSPARGGGYTERQSHEMIIGDQGYLHDAGFLGLLTDADRPLPADQMAATRKTELLLNPHLLLETVTSEAKLLGALPAEMTVKGRLFGVEEAMPVTLDRVRQTGKRTLLATQAWLDGSKDTRFHDLMVEEVQIDSEWLSNWRTVTSVDVATLHRVVIDHKVHPITLYVDRATGLPTKIETLEWDVVYGDVALDVNYMDWREIHGVKIPHRILMSIGGAPRIEVTRSELEVNPVFDAEVFRPPEGVVYVHDEDVAARASKLSQSLLMFGFAGVGRPTIESVKLSEKIQLLYAAPKDGVFTMVVEQENSLVVIEPGQNDLKGEVVIDRLAQDYPGKPISHLIVSHHHNDHGAGIRPYIAAGATLVVAESAVEFFERQASRPVSVVLQDALDRNPRPAKIIGVPEDAPYRIEDAELPVVVYPLEMRHVTDMVFVFVEGENLLYGGDLYISGLARDLRAGRKRAADILPFHAAQSLDEGIKQYDLSVASLIGSHDQQAVVYQDLVNYLSDDE